MLERIVNGAKKGILIGLVSLATATGALANKITQVEPDYVSDPANVRVDAKFKNLNNGAVYDSYDINLYSNLIDRLWALPHNQAAYTNKAEMVNDINFVVQNEPTGEVDVNWAPNVVGNMICLEHGPGFPDFDYDQWYAKNQNPAQDTVYLSVAIPKEMLDGNGNGYSTNDVNDYFITNLSTTNEMGVARNGIDSWSADSEPYDIQPNQERFTTNGYSRSFHWNNFTNENAEAYELLDSDGDGQNNIEESIAETDPNDQNDILKVNRIGYTNGTPVIYFDTSSTNRNYRLLCTDSLSNGTNSVVWTAVGEVQGDGQESSVTDTNSIPARRFYKIEVYRP